MSRRGVSSGARKPRPRGREALFRAFVEDIAHRCQTFVGDRCAYAIELCSEILSRGAHSSADEQVLYASALLVTLLKHRQPASGCAELLRQARGHSRVFDDSSIGKVQNYIEGSFYPKVFATYASAFRESWVSDLRVAIVGSGTLNYVSAIRDGFVSRIRRVCAQWSPVVSHVGSSFTSLDPGPWEASLGAIRAAEEHAPIDYLVAIGTQAAIVLKRTFPPSPTRQLLFLGVTNPVDAGLVRRFTPPHEEDASGVAYCNGVAPIVTRLQRLFPTRSLVFVYRLGVPQDTSLANELRRSFPRIQVIATSDFPAVSDLVRNDAVYFSWYTLDYMFEHAHHHAAPILQSRIVVTTTLANTLSNARSPVAIGAQDHEIGEIGADMLLRATGLGRTLRTEAVHIPELHIRVNRDAIERLGLRLDADERIR